MSVRMSVCLSARVFQISRVLTSRHFLHACLIVAVARSSSDDSAIRYVLPVLRLAPCFHIVSSRCSMRRSQYLRDCRAAASSHRFPTYSSGGIMLFNFVVVYNGSKLRTGSEVCYLSFPSQKCRRVSTKYILQNPRH